jgi:transcriptional regulator with XRE-family HTH domain
LLNFILHPKEKQSENPDSHYGAGQTIIHHHQLFMKEENIIGKRLKQVRFNSGLDQLDFATRLDCSRQLISRYETGRQHISPTVIVALAQEFKVSPAWLLGIEEIDHGTSLRDLESTKKENEFLRKENEMLKEHLKTAQKLIDRL